MRSSVTRACRLNSSRSRAAAAGRLEARCLHQLLMADTLVYTQHREGTYVPCNYLNSRPPIPPHDNYVLRVYTRPVLGARLRTAFNATVVLWIIAHQCQLLVLCAVHWSSHAAAGSPVSQGTRRWIETIFFLYSDLISGTIKDSKMGFFRIVRHAFLSCRFNIVVSHARLLHDVEHLCWIHCVFFFLLFSPFNYWFQTLVWS